MARGGCRCLKWGFLLLGRLCTPWVGGHSFFLLVLLVFLVLFVLLLFFLFFGFSASHTPVVEERDELVIVEGGGCLGPLGAHAPPRPTVLGGELQRRQHGGWVLRLRFVPLPVLFNSGLSGGGGGGCGFFLLSLLLLVLAGVALRHFQKRYHLRRTQPILSQSLQHFTLWKGRNLRVKI